MTGAVTDQAYPSLDDFRREVRAWLEANCPASMRQPLKAEDMVWSGSRVEFASADQRLWFERMRDRGWFSPQWPREYGGAGLNRSQAQVLEEEMRALGCRQPQFNLGIWMLGPVLLEFGTPDQQAEHLPGMSHGTVRWCQGFSEPGAGSDLASLRMAAVPDGDDFIITGQKIWTSYGDQSDWMYALVRTDPSARKQDGISFILIDMKLPGVTARPITLISGKSSFCEVFFDHVRVPQRQVIGGVNKGWGVAKRLLEHERSAMGKFSEGSAPSHDLVEAARGLLADQDPAWADDVVRVAMEQEAFGWAMARLREGVATGHDVRSLSALVKLVQSEQESRKYELLHQLSGWEGLYAAGDGPQQPSPRLPLGTQGDELTRLWLLAKTYTIAGGSSEIQLNLIARRVLELPDGADATRRSS